MGFGSYSIPLGHSQFIHVFPTKSSFHQRIIIISSGKVKMCRKKPLEYDGLYIYPEHADLETANYRYSFKATVKDDSCQAQMFTDHKCSELGEKYRGQNPKAIPQELTDVVGKKQRFQRPAATRGLTILVVKTSPIWSYMDA